MADLVGAVNAYVAYWPLNFALAWGLLAMLLLACLVAPWLRRDGDRGD